MPDTIVWQAAHATQTAARAAQALADGQLVALPAETGYAVVAAATAPTASERLRQIGTMPWNIALPSADDLPKWLPDLSVPARRLSQRCWPGPLTLLVEDALSAPAVAALPEAARQGLARDSAIGFCRPGDSVFLAVLEAGPLLTALLSAPTPTPAQQAEHTSLNDLAAACGDLVALFIDDGPRPARPWPTEVRLRGSAWEIARDGAFPSQEVRELAACRIVFLCTGNTCRSPLAQALCQQMLAARLGCAPAELLSRGYVVQSAGLGAYAGEPATPHAVDTAREFGADLTGHRSQPLHLELLAYADFLFTMTHGHLQTLCSLGVPLGPPPRLLSPQGVDVADPLGSDVDAYRDCVRQMRQYLEELLPQMLS